MRELDAIRARYLPQLAAVFGVRPWETDLLTVGEFLGLVAHLAGGVTHGR